MKTKKLTAAFAVCAMSLLALATAVHAEGEVAQIGETKYATLQAAVDAAKSGDTIELIADTTVTANIDIPSGITLTLDMNEKTITTDPVNEERTFDIYGDMTVTGNGKITCTSWGVFDVKDGGSLTIENGSYEAAGYRKGLGGGATLRTRSDSTVIVEDNVYIFNEKSCAVESQGDMTLGKCTLISESHNKLKDEFGKGLYSYCFINRGVAEINGTTIKGIQGALSTTSGGTTVINDGVIETYELEGTDSWYACYAANNANVTINGGSFTAFKRQAIYVGNEDVGLDGASIIINGGTFKSSGTDAAAVQANIIGNLEIRGGSYSTDVSQYLAPDTAVGQGADEMYNVISSENKATETGTYKTAVGDNDTYDQMSLFDADGISGSVTYNVTTDGKTKDFTFDCASVDSLTKLGLIVTDIPSTQTVTVELGGQNNG